MRTRERIPLHDHSDDDSGGPIDRSSAVLAVGGSDSSSAGGGSSGGTTTIVEASEPTVAFITDSAAWDGVIDYSVAPVWDITLTDDLTYTLAGAPAPGLDGRLRITFRQGAGGPHTVTHAAEVDWPDTDGTSGGSAPTLHTAEGAQDTIVLDTRDGGTTWGGSYDSAGGGSLTVEEDGETPVTDVNHIVFDGATVTDDGGGQVTVRPVTRVVTITDSSSWDGVIDLALGTVWDITLTANTTITDIVNAPSAGLRALVELIIRQGGSGGYTLDFPASVLWQDPADGDDDGSAPTLFTAVDAQDDIELATVDGGSTWGGTHLSATVTGSSDPADDTAAWLPLSSVVDGDPVLVWDGDDSLIPTLVPL